MPTNSLMTLNRIITFVQPDRYFLFHTIVRTKVKLLVGTIGTTKLVKSAQ